MKTQKDTHGASPLPKGKGKLGELFKKPKKQAAKRHRDLSGQTDTSLKEMKKRLREVPKKSAATAHDKTAYEEREDDGSGQMPEDGEGDSLRS